MLEELRFKSKMRKRFCQKAVIVGVDSKINKESFMENDFENIGSMLTVIHGEKIEIVFIPINFDELDLSATSVNYWVINPESLSKYYKTIIKNPFMIFDKKWDGWINNIFRRKTGE